MNLLTPMELLERLNLVTPTELLERLNLELYFEWLTPLPSLEYFFHNPPAFAVTRSTHDYRLATGTLAW